MARYTAVLTHEIEEGGYSVRVPALPGLSTQGDTYDEAIANARSAIAFHLDCLVQDCLVQEGEPIPEESAAPQLVAVDV